MLLVVTGCIVHQPLPLELFGSIQKLLAVRNCLLLDEPVHKAVLTWFDAR